MKLGEIFDEYIIKSEQLIIAKRSMNQIAINEVKRLQQQKQNYEI